MVSSTTSRKKLHLVKQSDLDGQLVRKFCLVKQTQWNVLKQWRRSTMHACYNWRFQISRAWPNQTKCKLQALHLRPITTSWCLSWSKTMRRSKDGAKRLASYQSLQELQNRSSVALCALRAQIHSQRNWILSKSILKIPRSHSSERRYCHKRRQKDYLTILNEQACTFQLV